MKQSHTITKENNPAFFSDTASPRMTQRYGHFNTSEILAFLEGEGWTPKMYGQKGFNKRTASTRSELQSYTKHYARFSKNDKLIVGELIPELYLVNSHDGSSKLQIETAFMRVACENGLIVRDHQFGRIDIKHSMNNVKEIKPMLSQFVDNFTQVSNRVTDLKAVQLTSEEQIQLAEIAMKLRWGAFVPKILAEKVIGCKRVEDEGNDLWKVYNRVQENLVKGGLVGEGLKSKKNGETRLIKTRHVSNIDVEISFNTKLWDVVNNKLTTGEFVLN